MTVPLSIPLDVILHQFEQLFDLGDSRKMTREARHRMAPIKRQGLAELKFMAHKIAKLTDT